MKKQITIDRKTKKVLDSSLILLSKSHSIEYCLLKYKKYRDAVEDLAILEQLKTIIPVEPDENYLKSSLERIYSRSEDKVEDHAEEINDVEKIGPDNGGRRRLILKPAIVFFTILTFFIFSLAGTIHASRESIPGKVLYPVKRSVEKVRLYIYPDSRMGLLHLQLLNNRLYEADILIDTDFDDVKVIEGLIIEIENEFLQCKKYDFFGSNTEVEMENMIDDIKNRYQDKFGQIEIEEEDTIEIDSSIEDKNIYDYYDEGSYGEGHSEKDPEIDKDEFIDDPIDEENGNGVMDPDSDTADEDENSGSGEEELDGDNSTGGGDAGEEDPEEDEEDPEEDEEDGDDGEDGEDEGNGDDD